MTTSDETAGSAADLVSVDDDDPRLGPPSRITEVPVDPQLRLLPTHEMEWPDFERLLLRVAREVRGLRAMSLFGVSGQAQDGLDAVGLNAWGHAEGVQGKRYTSFDVADLDAAAAKFTAGSLPFRIQRLFVGVASSAHARALVERVLEINRQLAPLELELWDRDRLSELLRKRPEVVLEFFGAVTATSFCVPHTIGRVEVPGPDAVTLADAVLVGPASTGKAGVELEQAKATRAGDPAAALVHLRNAQRLLTDAGFPAHATALDDDAIDLLGRLGRHADAARVLLDRVWDALRADTTSDAESAARALDRLSSEPQRTADDPVRAQAAVARTAVEMYGHPLGQLPAPEAVAAAAGDDRSDRARLVLLAGEIALADGARDWLSVAAPTIAELADQVATVDATVAQRLRLVAADVTGEWSALLRDARTRAIPRPLAALTLARHGRYLASRGNRDDADASWAEAIEQGCLAGLHEDASDWVYARRSLAMRYGIPNEDVWHPIAAALRARPAQPRVAAAPGNVRERALEALHNGKPREAALRLRRHLRDEVVSGSWQGEQDARALLASTYADVGEAALAAKHVVAAGDATQAKELAARVGDTYLDVREHLASPTYWTAATAYQLIAAQGDVVPDAHAEEIAGRALAVLDDARDGTLVDTPLFAPSLYLSAHAALAALADRLAGTDAARLLEHLEPLTDAAEGHYHRTDDDHARAAASIAEGHPSLREQALGQLLRLLARAPHAVNAHARDLIVEHLQLTRDRLVDLATAGSSDAAELLAHAHPDDVAGDATQAAAAALTAPLTSGPGHYAMGTDAVGKSILARVLPPDRRAGLIREQLRRVRSPHESAQNRSEYLLAAANLADNLADTDVKELLPLALDEATSPASSDADGLTSAFGHPLGAMRIALAGDSRTAAALLAARLASTAQQRDQARAAALRLIGADSDSDYYVTRALQVLQDDLARDIPYLAKQGWALRSLAAIAWANADDSDPQIGGLLAGDPDPRVRRALADALARARPTPRTDDARDTLHADPRHSVRRLLPQRGAALPFASG